MGAAPGCAERTNSEIIVSIVSTVSGREAKGYNEAKHLVHYDTAGLLIGQRWMSDLKVSRVVAR
jgi:hypothetical protein